MKEWIFRRGTRQVRNMNPETWVEVSMAGHGTKGMAHFLGGASGRRVGFLVILAAVALLGVGLSPARAGFTSWTSRSAFDQALGITGSDTVNWGNELGQNNLNVRNPFSFTYGSSIQGEGQTSSSASFPFATQIQGARGSGATWPGNFNPGDSVLWKRGRSSGFGVGAGAGALFTITPPCGIPTRPMPDR